MYLIIPDIHGRDFWKDAIDKVDISKDTVVFLGDYLDPYDQEFDGMPYDMLIEDTINNFKEILDFKTKKVGINFPTFLITILFPDDKIQI